MIEIFGVSRGEGLLWVWNCEEIRPRHKGDEGSKIFKVGTIFRERK